MGLENFPSLHLAGKLPPEMVARIWAALRFLERKGKAPEGVADNLIGDGTGGVKSMFLRYVIKCWLEAVEEEMLKEGGSVAEADSRAANADSQVEDTGLLGGENRELPDSSEGDSGEDRGASEPEGEEIYEI